MANSTTIFPLMLWRDIPKENITLSDNDTIVVVVGNSKTVRIPATTFLQADINLPTSANSEGGEGQITWSSDGVFTFRDGEWGLSPRLIDHWADYDKYARFLLVSKDQNLNEQEKAQGRKNLGIDAATTEKSGLVTLSSGINKDDANIPTGQNVYEFVVNTLNKIPLATKDSKGFVRLADEVSVLAVDTVPTGAQVAAYVTKKIQEFERSMGDLIANYQGNVGICGPDNEEILVYDPATRTLKVGVGVNIIQTQTADRIELQRADGTIETNIDTSGLGG